MKSKRSYVFVYLCVCVFVPFSCDCHFIKSAKQRKSVERIKKVKNFAHKL